MNLDDLIAQFSKIPMKIQSIVNRLLIGIWLWMSFYLAYKDAFTEDPTFPEMLLFIIRFFTRPIEYVIDKLFYS